MSEKIKIEGIKKIPLHDDEYLFIKIPRDSHAFKGEWVEPFFGKRAHQVIIHDCDIEFAVIKHKERVTSQQSPHL